VRKTKIFNLSSRIKSRKHRATFDARGRLTGYSFGGNPVADYGVAGTWGARYGVAGALVTGTGSSFTLEILVNTSVRFMFSQINIDVLYILVKLPIISPTLYILYQYKVA
jgi:hypothetical protein